MPLHKPLNSSLIALFIILVSISGEMPLHKPHRNSLLFQQQNLSFNLRRDAAPQATTVPNHNGFVKFYGVSISGEMPLHKPPKLVPLSPTAIVLFQSQAR